MNSIRISVIIFMLFQSLILPAQENNSSLTKTIKGTVIDKVSRLPIAGVNIRLLSDSSIKPVSTDQKGRFQLPGVSIGRHILQASYIGYQSTSLSELLVTSGKEPVYNVEMDQQSNNLKELVINGGTGKKPLNQMALTSARSFSPEETNRYAGGFFDPARMAQSFAGVVAGGDDNEIIVRGNSPKSLQWRLEGIEIINPNHFGSEGSSGGAVSMINTGILGTSDFYTGALPAEYSNASSGAFDLKFRKGNTEKREYALTIGVLGAGIALEGPFKKGADASYLISYRYSSLSLLEKAGLDISDEGVPKYQDLSFNFVFPSKKAGTFSLFGIGGSGALQNEAKRDYTKWEERADSRDVDFGFDAASIGLKHQYIANSKLYFSNIISFSGSRNSGKVDTLTNDYSSSINERTKFENTAFRYAGLLNYNLSPHNTFRAGINANLLGYNLFARTYDGELKRLKEVLNEKGNTSSFDAFLQYKAELGSGLSLNTGIHANYFTLSESWNLEPRIGLNLDAGSGQTLSFAAGLYSRIEPLSYYFGKNEKFSSPTTQEKLKPTKSAQIVLGYEKQFEGNLRFKTEAYYQHQYDVPVSSDPAINFSMLNVSNNYAIASSSYRTLVNKGTGKNYGLELSLEKSLSKGYYYMLSTSLFDAKFKALSGKEFNTSFNTQYSANLVLGKEWKTGKTKGNLFGLNTKLIYAGGRKYSPVLVEESFRLDEEVIDESRVNTLTADPYFRVDFSSSYRINSKKVSHLLILDIQNIMNRQNTIGTHYNPSKRIIEPIKWIGMIPTINYRLEF